MPASHNVVRQTVSLPADTVRQVRSLAKQQRLSANRIIVELVEDGIEARKRKQKEFFELAERFRAATDPKEVARLGDDLGRMIFGH
jgi:EAL domain-containing protein (putative c-di-GMP-specific phosphodiesterase class I)